MIRVKEVSQKELHWLIPNINVGDQANTRVRQYLGDDHVCFAKCSVAAGRYIWLSDEQGWIPFNDETPAFERGLVNAALRDLRARVATKVPNLAEKILHVPNNDYIFYKMRPDGRVAVLLTAWGFRGLKPNPTPPPNPFVVNDPIAVCVSFLRDGVRVPNHKFRIVGQMSNNIYETDDTGICDFGKGFSVGEIFEIEDIESTRRYTFHVEQGKSEYSFDITERVPLYIVVTENGVPKAGEQVVISLQNTRQTLMTDEHGVVNTMATYVPDAVVSVEVRDKHCDAMLKRTGNDYTFNFDVEVPLPERTVNVLVKVIRSDEPVANQNVEICYMGQTFNGITNEFGCVNQSLSVVSEAECIVRVDDSSQSRVLVTDIEQFLFELEAASLKVPHIVVKDHNDTPMPSYPISVEYNGVTTEYLTNEIGVVELSELTPNLPMTIYDGNDATNKCTYMVLPNKDEYVFTIFNNDYIYVTVIDRNNCPVSGGELKLIQGETNREFALDGNGACAFGVNEFAYNEPITAHMSYSDKRSLGSVGFELVETEREYVLQEQQQGSKWWKIMLEILFILALLALIFVIGYFASDWINLLKENGIWL